VNRKKHIVILGGGFAGLYVALELEKQLARSDDFEFTLINRENFFLFTPMLHEVAASDLDLTTIVNPVRKFLRRGRFFEGNVERIDIDNRAIEVSHGFDEHHHQIEYDHVVLALGSVTNFYGLPGLAERALTMKSLGDAIHLRNHLIATLEEADSECCLEPNPLLTFVVAGGGFAGVETVAGINDFLRDALHVYPRIRAEQLRVVLVHPGPYILPELGEKLGAYAQQKLSRRGVEILTNTRVAAVTPTVVELSTGEQIPSATMIWTAGTSPNPLLMSLPCMKDRGRLAVDATMEVDGWPGVWAIGDCAAIPDVVGGGQCPPTAQHAIRQGKVLARNILASIRGGEKKPFRFKTIGQLAAIGKRTGVARIFGVNFSGFFAWWMWRTIYLAKLPRFEKKVRVALDWTLDLIFSKDLVQVATVRSYHGAAHSGDSARSDQQAMTQVAGVER
jgi:NADH:ubiquinone reductase (H+-translocating)